MGLFNHLFKGPQVDMEKSNANARKMRELFLSLSGESGVTILFSSHILSEIEHVADKVGVIADGRILCESDLSQIKSEYNGSLEDYFFNLMSGGKEL